MSVREATRTADPVAWPAEVLAWAKGAATVAAGQRVGDTHSQDGRVHFVQSGWLAQRRHLRDGRQQITMLWLPGDMVPRLDASFQMADTLTALSDCKVFSAPAAALQEARLDSAALDAWLGRAERRHAAMLAERIVSLGRRSARERAAHLLCELLVRLGDPAEVQRLPLTQMDLADVLGLSTVHVNRTLQALRRASLAHVQRGRLDVPDFAALAQQGDFDPGYLA